MSNFTESVVEDAALCWLESLGWTVILGPDIAPETPAAERDACDQVILTGRIGAAFRAVLLPRLLSRQIRVRETERLAAEVT